MINYNIYNKDTREIQFTAEIKCKESTDTPIKTGLAVKWAIKNDADLTDADLTDADGII